MAAKTTKRRKVWVNEYEHELGSIAWHVRRDAAKKREDVTGTIAFIEAHPGDVVLSRETVAAITHLITALSSPGELVERARHGNDALTLLRGGR